MMLAPSQFNPSSLQITRENTITVVRRGSIKPTTEDALKTSDYKINHPKINETDVKQNNEPEEKHKQSKNNISLPNNAYASESDKNNSFEMIGRVKRQVRRQSLIKAHQ